LIGIIINDQREKGKYRNERKKFGHCGVKLVRASDYISIKRKEIKVISYLESFYLIYIRGMIRLIIADNSQIVQTGLHSIFSNYENIEIIGDAANEAKLTDLLLSFEADILLIDFTAPGFSVDSVRQSLRLQPKLKIVALTADQSGATIVNALRAGVTSYIRKDCDVNEILDSVRETAAGSVFFCGNIVDRIRKEAIDVEDLAVSTYDCEPTTISNRENEIITLIAEGYTNAEIAEKLFLSTHTVNTHRKNIMHKLGVNNTAAIVMYAVKKELVSPNKFLFAPSANA
jgi:DNA-binding NarL/FixJ family response regulator